MTGWGRRWQGCVHHHLCHLSVAGAAVVEGGESTWPVSGQLAAELVVGDWVVRDGGMMNCIL